MQPQRRAPPPTAASAPLPPRRRFDSHAAHAPDLGSRVPRGLTLAWPALRDSLLTRPPTVQPVAHAPITPRPTRSAVGPPAQPEHRRTGSPASGRQARARHQGQSRRLRALSTSRYSLSTEHGPRPATTHRPPCHAHHPRDRPPDRPRRRCRSRSGLRASATPHRHPQSAMAPPRPSALATRPVTAPPQRSPAIHRRAAPTARATGRAPPRGRPPHGPTSCGPSPNPHLSHKAHPTGPRRRPAPPWTHDHNATRTAAGPRRRPRYGR